MLVTAFASAKTMYSPTATVHGFSAAQEGVGRRSSSVIISRTPRLLCHACPPPSVPAAAARQNTAVDAPVPYDAVSEKYRGMSATDFHQAFHAEHPGLVAAITAVAAAMRPHTAAQLLRRLEAELPPALTDIVPGGDCAVVAAAPGLAALLERAADCAAASLKCGEPSQGAATLCAALSLASCLRFAGAGTAAPYAAAAVRCKQALKACYDAGALITEEDAADLEAACARASPLLWLLPYFGQRYAAAVDAFIHHGWSNAELAVRYAEAYIALLAAGRYQLVEQKFLRVVRAPTRHRLSLEQTERLLSATARLPAEPSIQLSLYARSHPAANWYRDLLAAHAERQAERAQRNSLQEALAQRAAAAGTSQLRGARVKLPLRNIVVASQ